MKPKIYILTALLGLFICNISSQTTYAEKQVIEFSNITSGNNFHTGDIYCFQNTKISFQLRISSFSGRFNGTVSFSLGDKSYTVSGREEDYLREVQVYLPKGKTTCSIFVYPDIENNNPCRASITIYGTNMGNVGSKNSITTIDN